MALWVSKDDRQTWAHREVITDFPGILSYPDGEVDAEELFLHFAFDYNRYDVIYWKVAIPWKMRGGRIDLTCVNGSLVEDLDCTTHCPPSVPLSLPSS